MSFSDISVSLGAGFLTVFLSYLSWTRLTSYTRNDVENFLENRITGRKFGHEYEFDVAISYTKDANHELLTIDRAEALKDEVYPYTIPDSNVVLWGYISNLQFDHLHADVEEQDGMRSCKFDFTGSEIRDEYEIESLTFEEQPHRDIKCRVEFRTAKIEQIRQALEDFDSIIGRALKKKHESNTEIPEAVFEYLDDPDYFVK